MKQYTSQCLFYALNKWHEEGGYLLLGRSIHWCIPHVLHMSNSGKVTHFAPNHTLRTPWHSLLGFKGIVFDRDSYERAPMNIICMFLGTAALALFGAVWAGKTYGIKLRKLIMIKLVENAKESWKWFSMQAMTLAGALQGTWVTIPPDLKAHVPTNAVHYATLALVIAGIFGRLVKQDAAK